MHRHGDLTRSIMIHFYPYNFFRANANKEKMLECIKFWDCKVKTIQIGNEWFVAVSRIDIALGVSSDTLKGIVRNYLLQNIGIGSSYDGS